MSCIGYKELFESGASLDKIDSKYHELLQNLNELSDPYDFGGDRNKRYNLRELTLKQLQYNKVGLMFMYIYLYTTSNGQVEIRGANNFALVFKTPNIEVANYQSKIDDYDRYNKYKHITNMDDLLYALNIYQNVSSFDDLKHFLYWYTDSNFITDQDANLALDIAENSIYYYKDIKEHYINNVIDKEKESHDRVLQTLFTYKKIKLYKEILKLLPPVGFDISNF